MEAEPIRALTIRQPWTWAIVEQGKNVENRSWQTTYRGLLAIHAGAQFDEDATMPVDRAERRLRALIAKIRRAHGSPPDAANLRLRRIIAVAELAGCHGPDDCWATCSPWAVRGQWHWNLWNVRPLAVPVPCKGALGLWRLPGDVEWLVRDQVEAPSG